MRRCLLVLAALVACTPDPATPPVSTNPPTVQCDSLPPSSPAPIDSTTTCPR
jgi:hypothetical protein